MLQQNDPTSATAKLPGPPLRGLWRRRCLRIPNAVEFVEDIRRRRWNRRITEWAAICIPPAVEGVPVRGRVFATLQAVLNRPCMGVETFAREGIPGSRVIRRRHPAGLSTQDTAAGGFDTVVVGDGGALATPGPRQSRKAEAPSRAVALEQVEAVTLGDCAGGVGRWRGRGGSERRRRP